MIQSSLKQSHEKPLHHVGLIMDGNRRWAREHGLPIAAGHRAGLERLTELIPCLENTAVEILTVYAFSADNWRRQQGEVEQLFALACEGFRRFTPTCIEHKIRVEVIGRRDRLPRRVLRAAEEICAATAHGKRTVRVALDYSGRESLMSAAARFSGSESMDAFSRVLNQVQHSSCPYRDLDLVIRTGREQRLSDFMLWECAYAELYFPDLYWPDFTPEAFHAALAFFYTRSRRFGG
jgi:undecaprenyl diphosphate synthase